jgi:S-adenosylmethionine hydrolase
LRTIALLTDFGTRDPYVAAMKGVIAARSGARIADLSHEIAPFDVWEGAFFLRAILPYWRNAVIVAVIDPGVGSARRIVAVERGDVTFLAPDNGVLTFAWKSPAEGEEGIAFHITDESHFLPNGSTTFHGRDRFAPLAAAIANGARASDLGTPVDDLVRLDYTPPSYGGRVVKGTIVAVDRFGNLITDVDPTRLPFASCTVRAGGDEITRVAQSYSELREGVFSIVGSAGCIELSVAGGSAAALLELRRGDRVEVVPRL